jgi:hypothetical protein
MRDGWRRAARWVVLAGLVALGAAYPAGPARAAATFSATGNFELTPGSQNVQSQLIVLSYGVLKTKVDLPADLAPDVSQAQSFDARNDVLPCTAVPNQPSYVCGTGSAMQKVTSVRFFYTVPQLKFGTWAQFPKTYDLGVTDLATKAKATVHVTVRAQADLIVHGPYAGNYNTHGNGILVYIENLGPSESQGSRVTFSFTGAYTTFTFPIPGECSAAGGEVSCPLGWLQLNRPVPVSVGLGNDSGVISIVARVIGTDADPDRTNNVNIGGPWNLFPGNGNADSAPPPPPAPGTARGVPLPVPAPDAAPSAGPPVPAGVSAPTRTPPPARMVSGTWPPSWARNLALAFLCVSSGYLAVAAVLWQRRRWRRRPVTGGGTVEIDLDR